MKIGVPKEIKNNENRVAITPAGVKELKLNGHQVLVEENAGVGSAFSNEDYTEAGARIVPVNDVWDCEIVVKIKEPLEPEYGRIKDQLIFTYLHLASAPKELTEVMLKSNCIGIAYETVEKGKVLPLLVPMSNIAGRIAIQIGAQYLAKTNGGRGVLIDGIAGVESGNVLIIGGGVVGGNAAKIAVGRGANVVVVDIDVERLNYLEEMLNGKITTLYSDSYNIAEKIRWADLVVGAVLIPGAKAPTLVTKEMISTMKKGSVVVDVAIDQGGCIETSKVTSHDNPVYPVDGVMHYGVPNMPAAYPRTSTIGITNATLPYLLRLANKGFESAMKEDCGFAKGINIYRGKLTYKAVADALGLEYTQLHQS
ncbi:MAG: alanine dehydrogenase [Candidatus Aenigmarchaeota archaeon]|nr:alanine dehydrogenase [Candidatus Aenigmarchaeota archaeon]